MDLRLTPAQLEFRRDVRQWLQDNVPADLREKTRLGQRLSCKETQRWTQILGRQGWVGHAWPAHFGGPGWDAVQRYLFEEEMARADAPRVLAFGPVMVAPVLMAFGSPEQQARHLPGIMSGEVWWCQGYSEPGSGSDLASLKMRADRQARPSGDVYVVNGQKAWTTLAQHADWIFCLVRTRFDGKPQTGISFLLIDMKSPGISVKPVVLLDGEHEVNEVFFDDVEVPVGNLVGEENQGWTYAKHLLAHERTSIADANRAKRALCRLKEIARAQGVLDDPRFRDQVALLEVDIVALEMLVLRVLCAGESGGKALDIAGLLKIRGSEIQQRYTELMMLAAGPEALPFVPPEEDDAEGPVPPGLATLAPSYFNHRKTTIYGGANEVQRNIVAQTVLN